MNSSKFLVWARWAGLIAIFAVGFWAPWERLGGAHPGSTWLWLAGSLAAGGLLTMGSATVLVIAIATTFLLLAALIRTWAAAYLGPDAVKDRELQMERLVASGPYRFVRCPLYLGTWLLTLALTILMPPGGALFALIGVAMLIFALVRAEERKLIARGGEAYTAYLRRVPQFLPAFSPRLGAGAQQPQWMRGFLGEIHFWGMAGTYLFFANRYNVTILEQGVLISIGIALLVRAVWQPLVPAAS
ncbi:MAG: methyltransferase family protein [Acidobacteriaceae bacterium]